MTEDARLAIWEGEIGPSWNQNKGDLLGTQGHEGILNSPPDVFPSNPVNDPTHEDE